MSEPIISEVENPIRQNTLVTCRFFAAILYSTITLKFKYSPPREPLQVNENIQIRLCDRAIL